VGGLEKREGWEGEEPYDSYYLQKNVGVCHLLKKRRGLGEKQTRKERRGVGNLFSFGEKEPRRVDLGKTGNPKNTIPDQKKRAGKRTKTNLGPGVGGRGYQKEGTGKSVRWAGGGRSKNSKRGSLREKGEGPPRDSEE